MWSKVFRYSLLINGLAMFATLATLSAQTKYSLVDIGDLGSVFPNSQAFDINDLGQVVGESNFSGNRYHAFLWDPTNGLTDLGAFPTVNDFSSAWAVNNHGEVVGNTNFHAFRWTADEGMINLGDLPGGSDWSAATDINDDGVVIGGSFVVANRHRAFRWTESSGMTDLGAIPSGDGTSTATAINHLGVIVGNSNFTGPLGGTQAVFWNHGIHPLSIQSEFVYPKAYSLNSFGDICGSVFLDDSYDERIGYLWSARQGEIPLEIIPRLPTYNVPSDINDAGVIVGWNGSLGPKTGFVWDARFGSRDLQTLLDDSGDGWYIRNASAINESGQIVGSAWTPDNITHGFVLTPTNTVVPGSVEVAGQILDGSVHDLAGSDNVDLTVMRRFSGRAIGIEVTVISSSTVAEPDSFLFSAESSVDRAGVREDLLLFNFENSRFDLVSSRIASLASDQITTVEIDANASSYVQAETGQVQAKIRFVSGAKEQFSAAIDEIQWNFE